MHCMTFFHDIAHLGVYLKKSDLIFNRNTYPTMFIVALFMINNS
jgi:hypothetical protein